MLQISFVGHFANRGMQRSSSSVFSLMRLKLCVIENGHFRHLIHYITTVGKIRKNSQKPGGNRIKELYL